MTNDSRLAHLGLADRRRMEAPLESAESLYRDDKDSSLRSE
jgi:hypothetical protein